MNDVTARDEVRDSILGLQAHMQHLIDAKESTAADCPLVHHFAPGTYGRQIHMPAGSLVVGKIHKHAHLNFLMSGTVSVMTEQGPETFSAPRVWVSQPGTKRVVYNHTDVVWVTVHATMETNLDTIEGEIIAKTYDEYDLLTQQKPEVQPCLG